MTPGAEKIDSSLLRVAFILVLGTFMATLDSTIVTIGLDALAEEFDAPVTGIQWASTAYLLAMVAAVPASGWLADRFGGRTTWLAAIAVFLVGSLLCALAWSVTSLIVFRFLQGLGGGLLPPTGQALLARIAGPGRVGRLISIVGVVPLLSPVLGPLAGGSILAVADWPWLFYVNVPIGLAAILLAIRYVPASPPAAQGAPFDALGAALLSPGLAVLVFGLTEVGGGDTGVNTVLATGALIAGAVMLAAFVAHGLRTRRVPLVDPRLFTRPPFAAAAFALLMLGAAVFGTMFLLPLYLQTGAELTAFETGLLLAPQGVGAALGSLVIARRIDQLAPRTAVLTGIVLVLCGTAPFTRLSDTPPDVLIAFALLLRGVGAAMISAPVMALVYSRVKKEELPRASGALNLVSTIGGSIGTAAVAVILQSRLTARAADVPAAYADTFWWVLAFCAASALAATRLPGKS
ncbi:DHA2 family efflux MFS transporter permease subunit [Nonomuraea sp. NN258]|uniref:DHA2 family efflux MFS transporter permease subunit n=1 Tax=Nonomuraea antri TaxID=2730852 RepID=UPI00156807C0|nr:DHA2 family efflux MFS transporter permease subunit [Nonomuraea antri]NRQ38198.1 DHA2 family efflux MFS transporter permease subunit [Nonomuraea antri]